jgi:hypothetical protein
MDKELLINVFSEFGGNLKAKNGALDDLMSQVEQHNPWFTIENQEIMIDQFIEQYFDKNALTNWLELYPEPVTSPKTVGMVLAGNVPFVGMHDILCVLAAGHNAQAKLSSKDTLFYVWLKKMLNNIHPDLADRFLITEQLSSPDAVIATGSNNTSRYFEYYFGKMPHIFRKNRTSVAIITGDESEEDLMNLGKDVFTYFGMGCRNVGKLLLPQGYTPTDLLDLWQPYSYLGDHNKYKNNLDYNLTLAMLNNEHPYASDFLILKETEQWHAPLATVYYSFYNNESETDNLPHDELQCVVSNKEGHVPFGETQKPTLTDYADHIDTMNFLHDL